MRIIAGILKGRKLNSPADERIRPTSDKVKESIFNMIAGYLEDAVVIDLFCGTGNLGIEAISRGAKKCYFADRSRESMNLTERNIAYCKIENASVTICSEYYKALERIHEKADVIFLDPPYKSGLLTDCFLKIEEKGLLAKDGIIVAEHGIEEELPLDLASFTKIRHKRYGKIIIEIYSEGTEE